MCEKDFDKGYKSGFKFGKEVMLEKIKQAKEEIHKLEKLEKIEQIVKDYDTNCGLEEYMYLEQIKEVLEQ